MDYHAHKARTKRNEKQKKKKKTCIITDQINKTIDRY